MFCNCLFYMFLLCFIKLLLFVMTSLCFVLHHKQHVFHKLSVEEGCGTTQRGKRRTGAEDKLLSDSNDSKLTA
jgi:hypothetical protein